MGHPRWKPLGLALAAAALTLGLAACAAGSSSTGQQVSTRVADGTPRPTPQTQKQQAEADAAAILASFAVPPGGHRLAGPPNLPGGVLKSPISYLGAAWEVHLTGFWAAPGSPQALLAWEQGHLRPRFTLGDADFGPPAWDREFDFAPAGALTSRELIVEVASAGHGQTGIRLDAWVAWQPPRPASTHIPASASIVTIAQLRWAGGAPEAVHGPITIANPATVRALAAVINALPLSTIAPYASCPATSNPWLSLTFRARPGGPAVATVQTDQPCGNVTLTIDGKQQPALYNQHDVDVNIRKLADLPWKAS